MNNDLENQLKNAQSSDAFMEIVNNNNLKYRSSFGGQFIICAYLDDTYKKFVNSKIFCSACGALATNPRISEWCKPCAISFDAWDFEEEEKLNPRKPIPYTDRLTDLPDHVIQGEIFEERLAMFRNEY